MEIETLMNITMFDPNDNRVGHQNFHACIGDQLNVRKFNFIGDEEDKTLEKSDHLIDLCCTDTKYKELWNWIINKAKEGYSSMQKFNHT